MNTKTPIASLTKIMTVLVAFEKMDIKKKILFILGIIVIFSFAALNLDNVFIWLISTTRNQETLQRRIQEIYYVTKMNSTSTFSDVYLRQEVYRKSWILFLDNPLIGGWFNSNIGGHSEILDLMGSMGLFGILFLLIILWTIKCGINPYYSELEARNKRIIKLMLLAMLMLIFLNPVLSSKEIGMAVFIVLLFIDYLEYHLS